MHKYVVYISSFNFLKPATKTETFSTPWLPLLSAISFPLRSTSQHISDRPIHLYLTYTSTSCRHRLLSTFLKTYCEMWYTKIILQNYLKLITYEVGSTNLTRMQNVFSKFTWLLLSYVVLWIDWVTTTFLLCSCE